MYMVISCPILKQDAEIGTNYLPHNDRMRYVLSRDRVLKQTKCMYNVYRATLLLICNLEEVKKVRKLYSLREQAV